MRPSYWFTWKASLGAAAAPPLRPAATTSAAELSTAELLSGAARASLRVSTVRMFLARLAYFRVLQVSSKEAAAGEMQEIITVLQLPPRES
jgi:hypothetical protein